MCGPLRQSMRMGTRLLDEHVQTHYGCVNQISRVSTALYSCARVSGGWEKRKTKHSPVQYNCDQNRTALRAPYVALYDVSEAAPYGFGEVAGTCVRCSGLPAAQAVHRARSRLERRRAEERARHEWVKEDIPRVVRGFTRSGDTCNSPAGQHAHSNLQKSTSE